MDESKTPRWQARKKALDDAADAAETARRESERRWRLETEHNYRRPGTRVWIGVVVSAIIILIVWFCFENLRCDPLVSNSRACRYERTHDF